MMTADSFGVCWGTGRKAIARCTPETVMDDGRLLTCCDQRRLYVYEEYATPETIGRTNGTANDAAPPPFAQHTTLL